jgi:sn-glycerol 3-phosphate transport system substrate-binding protein
MDLSTWEQVGTALDALKEAGNKCPLTTAWQSWVHLENLSAYHNVPFATKENGFAGVDTELTLNGPVQVQAYLTIGQWAKDGKFIYSGRRNEGGANFRAGECALFTESSAGYAGVKKEASSTSRSARCPYWARREGAPQNTIIGGASLWVMQGQTREEYKGVAAFFNFLSSSDDPGQVAPGHRLSADHHGGLRMRPRPGFYEENPGTDIAIIQMTGKAPTSNSKGLRLGLRPDPRHHRRRARRCLERGQVRTGSAGLGCRPRQRAAAPLRAGQPLIL